MKHILYAVLFFALSAVATAKTTKKTTTPAPKPSEAAPMSSPPPSMSYGRSAEYNFRFQPVHLLIGAFALNFDYAIDPDWTIGPALTYWRFSLSSDDTFYREKYEITYFSIGARATWFKNGVYTDGLYVGPNAGYVSAKLKTKNLLDEDVTGSVSVPMIGCLVGYGWFWDSFNMMLGGGARIGLGNTKVEIKSASGTETDVSAPIAGFDFEYSLGWTF